MALAGLAAHVGQCQNAALLSDGDLSPLHAADLGAPLTTQHQNADDLAVGVVAGVLPDRAQLVILKRALTRPLLVLDGEGDGVAALDQTRPPGPGVERRELRTRPIGSHRAVLLGDLLQPLCDHPSGDLVDRHAVERGPVFGDGVDDRLEAAAAQLARLPLQIELGDAAEGLVRLVELPLGLLAPLLPLDVGVLAELDAGEQLGRRLAGLGSGHLVGAANVEPPILPEGVPVLDEVPAAGTLEAQTKPLEAVIEEDDVSPPLGQTGGADGGVGELHGDLRRQHIGSTGVTSYDFLWSVMTSIRLRGKLAYTER